MAATTRDKLIDAASRLLDQGGPGAVTLREVGRLAGVSHNAPYKHFADKQDLLAAVAARELDSQRATMAALQARTDSAGAVLQAMLHGYVRWASTHPVRFKLTFGAWSTDSAALTEAATTARAQFVGAVAAAQAAGALPAGDPERVTALLMAVAHGAVDLALSGHLSVEGKGHATPDDLVDDLFAYLRRSG